MKLDNRQLLENSDRVNRNFNKMSEEIDTIINSFNLIMKNWDTGSSETFREKFKIVTNDFEIISNKFLNVNRYLENVLDNSVALENQMSNIITNMGNNLKA